MVIKKVRKNITNLTGHWYQYAQGLMFNMQCFSEKRTQMSTFVMPEDADK